MDNSARKDRGKTPIAASSYTEILPPVHTHVSAAPLGRLVTLVEVHPQLIVPLFPLAQPALKATEAGGAHEHPECRCVVLVLARPILLALQPGFVS
eukprot:scaffold69401_cov58-Phaeocystis_antarctica.AAC.1